jgi:hypothetical protein
VTGYGVISRKLVDAALQCDDSGCRQNASLAHASSEYLAYPPCFADEIC